MPGSYRRLLTNRRLVRLLTAQFVSSTGDWIYLVAVLVAVYETTRDPFLLAVVGAGRILPFAVLAIPAGVLADRFDRRGIILVCDALLALLMFLAVPFVDGAPALAIIGFALLASTIAAFRHPAASAFIPDLVGDASDLAPANSAMETLENLAFVVGPALAGLVVVAGGLSAAFAINAATFAVVALVVWSLPARRPQESIESTLPEPVRSSRWRRLIRTLVGPILIDTATSVAGGAVAVLAVAIAVDQVHAGSDAAGYLTAAIGAGGIVAGVLGLSIMGRQSTPILLGGVLIGGAALALLAVSSDLGAALLCIGAMGAALVLLDVLNLTFVQRTVSRDELGRAMGIVGSTATWGAIAGSFAAPLFAGAFGVQVTEALLGALVFGMGVLGVGAIRRGPARAAQDAVDPHVLDVVRSSPLGILPVGRLEIAARALQRIEVRAGTRVVHEGAVADQFYLIESGTFVASQRHGQGDERILRRMGRGEGFGQLGLMGSGLRTASVTAATNGILWSLAGPTFLEVVKAGPGLAARLIDLHGGAG